MNSIHGNLPHSDEVTLTTRTEELTKSLPSHSEAKGTNSSSLENRNDSRREDRNETNGDCRDDEDPIAMERECGEFLFSERERDEAERERAQDLIFSEREKAEGSLWIPESYKEKINSENQRKAVDKVEIQIDKQKQETESLVFQLMQLEQGLESLKAKKTLPYVSPVERSGKLIRKNGKIVVVTRNHVAHYPLTNAKYNFKKQGEESIDETTILDSKQDAAVISLSKSEQKGDEIQKKEESNETEVRRIMKDLMMKREKQKQEEEEREKEKEEELKNKKALKVAYAVNFNPRIQEESGKEDTISLTEQNIKDKDACNSNLNKVADESNNHHKNININTNADKDMDQKVDILCGIDLKANIMNYVGGLFATSSLIVDVNSPMNNSLVESPKNNDAQIMKYLQNYPDTRDETKVNNDQELSNESHTSWKLDNTAYLEEEQWQNKEKFIKLSDDTNNIILELKKKYNEKTVEEDEESVHTNCSDLFNKNDSTNSEEMEDKFIVDDPIWESRGDDDDILAQRRSQYSDPILKSRDSFDIPFEPKTIMKIPKDDNETLSFMPEEKSVACEIIATGPQPLVDNNHYDAVESFKNKVLLTSSELLHMVAKNKFKYYNCSPEVRNIDFGVLGNFAFKFFPILKRKDQFDYFKFFCCWCLNNGLSEKGEIKFYLKRCRKALYNRQRMKLRNCLQLESTAKEENFVKPKENKQDETKSILDGTASDLASEVNLELEKDTLTDGTDNVEKEIEDESTNLPIADKENHEVVVSDEETPSLIQEVVAQTKEQENEPRVEEGGDEIDSNTTNSIKGKSVNANDLEVDYEDGANNLYRCIEERDWNGAMMEIERDPSQARIWIFRKQYNSTLLRWRVLPLHASCIFLSPPALIEALIAAYPESPQIKDDRCMLPVHLACKNGASNDIISILINAFPNCVSVKDSKGRTPLDLVKSHSSQKKEASSSQSKEGVNFAIQKIQEEYSSAVEALSMMASKIVPKSVTNQGIPKRSTKEAKKDNNKAFLNDEKKENLKMEENPPNDEQQDKYTDVGTRGSYCRKTDQVSKISHEDSVAEDLSIEITLLQKKPDEMEHVNCTDNVSPQCESKEEESNEEDDFIPTTPINDRDCSREDEENTKRKLNTQTDQEDSKVTIEVETVDSASSVGTSYEERASFSNIQDQIIDDIVSPSVDYISVSTSSFAEDTNLSTTMDEGAEDPTLEYSLSSDTSKKSKSFTEDTSLTESEKLCEKLEKEVKRNLIVTEKKEKQIQHTLKEDNGYQSISSLHEGSSGQSTNLMEEIINFIEETEIEQEVQEKAEEAEEIEIQKAKEIEIQKAKEIEMQKAKEIKMQKAKEVEMQKAKEIEMQKAKEIEMQKAKEIEMQKAKEIEMQKAKEIEMQKAKEIEMQKAKEIEMQKAKEVEMQKAKEVEMQKAKEVEMQKAKEAEMQKAKEVKMLKAKEAKMQKAKEVKMQKAKEAEMQKAKEIEMQRAKEMKMRKARETKKQEAKMIKKRKDEFLRRRVRSHYSKNDTNNAPFDEGEREILPQAKQDEKLIESPQQKSNNKPFDMGSKRIPQAKRDTEMVDKYQVNHEEDHSEDEAIEEMKTKSSEEVVDDDDLINLFLHK